MEDRSSERGPRDDAVDSNEDEDDPRDRTIADLRQEIVSLRSRLWAEKEVTIHTRNCLRENFKEEVQDFVRNLQQDREQHDFRRVYPHMPATWQEDRDIALMYLHDFEVERKMGINTSDRMCYTDLNDLPKLLREDEEFLSSFFKANPQLMVYMNVEMQVMFSDLVKQCLRDLIAQGTLVFDVGVRTKSFAAFVAEEIREKVWQDRDLLWQWCKAGGNFCDYSFGNSVSSLFPKAMQSDKEVFLWIAEMNEYALQSFEGGAAPELLADKDFMAKCIKFNPFLFCVAQNDLKLDLEIILLAFGNERGNYPLEHHCFKGGSVDYLAFLHKGLASINEELKRDEEYFESVLIRLAQHSSSCLPHLSEASIQIISSFAVPSEAKLVCLCTAQENFQHCIEQEQDSQNCIELEQEQHCNGYAQPDFQHWIEQEQEQHLHGQVNLQQCIEQEQEQHCNTYVQPDFQHWIEQEHEQHLYTQVNFQHCIEQEQEPEPRLNPQGIFKQEREGHLRRNKRKVATKLKFLRKSFGGIFSGCTTPKYSSKTKL